MTRPAGYWNPHDREANPKVPDGWDCCGRRFCACCLYCGAIDVGDPQHQRTCSGLGGPLGWPDDGFGDDVRGRFRARIVSAVEKLRKGDA